MYELTKRGARFVRDDRCCQAFETLKVRLCSAPVLATPTHEGGYVLGIDASTHGAGAILHQYQNGQLRVIVFVSRAWLFNAGRPGKRTQSCFAHAARLAMSSTEGNHHGGWRQEEKRRWKREVKKTRTELLQLRL